MLECVNLWNELLKGVVPLYLAVSHIRFEHIGFS
jgi:hypothetical protein